MIKFVVAALWIVAATIGSIFFAFSATNTGEAPHADAQLLGGLDYMKTDIISVPVIRKSEVQGYFLARLVFTVEPEEIKKLSLPPQVLFVDQLYSYIYSSPHIDFSHTETLDVDAFRAEIRDSINLRLGKDLIHDVLVEQIDYLTKAEIRDNNVRRRMPSE